jgi:hypothetical protein
MLHGDSKLIPKTGFGYKIFERRESKLTPMCDSFSFGKLGKWVKWDSDRFGGKGIGFCFFLTKEEADRLLLAWNKDTGIRKCIIMQIEYNNGLGTHSEHNIMCGRSFQIALCREFRIVKSWIPKAKLLLKESRKFV